MVVVFGVGVGIGGCRCGFERCEWGGVRLGFEEGSRHAGLVADAVFVVVTVVIVAGGVEEHGGLKGKRAGPLFSTRLLRGGARGYFCIHPS